MNARNKNLYHAKLLIGHQRWKLNVKQVILINGDGA
jgi:hypothetical protein